MNRAHVRIHIGGFRRWSGHGIAEQFIEVAGLVAKHQTGDREARMRDKRFAVEGVRLRVIQPGLHLVGELVRQDIVLATGVVDANDIHRKTFSQLAA